MKIGSVLKDKSISWRGSVCYLNYYTYTTSKVQSKIITDRCSTRFAATIMNEGSKRSGT
jgi:hypothetical protein